jgi:hypothetical protein
VKLRRDVFLLLAFLLLMLGLGAFHFLNPAQPSEPVMETGFRQWFWDLRSPDLIVQMALVFAGALAIAAILPLEEDHDD